MSVAIETGISAKSWVLTFSDAPDSVFTEMNVFFNAVPKN
jgi:hypothetical protein